MIHLSTVRHGPLQIRQKGLVLSIDKTGQFQELTEL